MAQQALKIRPAISGWGFALAGVGRLTSYF